MNLRLLFSKEEISKRVEQVGREIALDYRDDQPVLAVCVLKGGVIFFSDLTRAITDKTVMFDFMTLSSYGNGTVSSGNVRLISGLKESVEGKHVLIVEDIVDTGNTVEFIKNYFKDKSALSVKIACLLDKPKNRKKDVSVDYAAFTLADAPFVVGYGLDRGQKYRNLSSIYEVTE